MLHELFFFFSSRRRHTRSLCDWSSDVCSSDLMLTPAIAVEDAIFNLAHVGGPALGGLLVAGFGFAGAYGVDVATFAASLAAIWLLPTVPVAPDAERPSVRSIVAGFRYVRAKPVLLGIFVVDANAMLFGMPSALFPAFAHELGG